MRYVEGTIPIVASLRDMPDNPAGARGFAISSIACSRFSLVALCIER